MENNNFLTILIAFIVGLFAHQMMKNMCGRLVEGWSFEKSILLPLLSFATESADMRAGAGGNLGGGNKCYTQFVDCPGIIGKCCLGTGVCTHQKCNN